MSQKRFKRAVNIGLMTLMIMGGTAPALTAVHAQQRPAVHIDQQAELNKDLQIQMNTRAILIKQINLLHQHQHLLSKLKTQTGHDKHIQTTKQHRSTRAKAKGHKRQANKRRYQRVSIRGLYLVALGHGHGRVRVKLASVHPRKMTVAQKRYAVHALMRRYVALLHKGNHIETRCLHTQAKLDKYHQSHANIVKYSKIYMKQIHELSCISRLSNRCVHNKFKEPKIPVKHIESEYRKWSFRDINHDREAHHIAPVRWSHRMDKVAHQRAWQLTTNYSHYSKHGHVLMMISDAKHQHGYFNGNYAENIGGNMYGNTPQLTGQNYQTRTGGEMAAATEDGMMNHDAFVDRRPNSPARGQTEHWGHRRNILNGHYASVGIAVSYSKKQNQFFVAEDFYGSVNQKRHVYHGKNHYRKYHKARKRAQRHAHKNARHSKRSKRAKRARTHRHNYRRK